MSNARRIIGGHFLLPRRIGYGILVKFEVVHLEQSTNSILLRGELRDLPAFSHENHGSRFFRLTLDVPRLSGAVDSLPVVVPEALLQQLDPTAGDMLTVSGQIRSHNQREDGVRRLLVFVYAQSITAECGDPINQVSLCGPLCREPSYRRTPLGREICDIMLALPRGFHRADYLPCIVWGRTAQEISQCHTRDWIGLTGRLQSRIYTKYIEGVPQERTAYEVSAMQAHSVSNIDE